MRYYHIGHADPEDTIWIWLDGSLILHRAESHSHEGLYGKAASEQNWRGRFEKRTRRLSVLAPVGHPENLLPPRWLQDRLEYAFGTDEIYYFNPPTREGD